MWIVIKYKRNEQNFLINELREKFGGELKHYIPQISLNYFVKNRVKNTKKPLLGDYMFCFHSKFVDQKYLNILNFTKGVKKVLKDFLNSQEEINFFVNKCLTYENGKGCLTQDFFDFNNNNTFKFCSGPFTNMVFDIIKRENRTKLKCLLGNFKLTITGKHNLYFPA